MWFCWFQKIFRIPCLRWLWGSSLIRVSGKRSLPRKFGPLWQYPRHWSTCLCPQVTLIALIGKIHVDWDWFSFPWISSLFTSHLNLNETATNSTVPWGLWALPTSLADFSLPTLPNVADVPGIGRRKRQVSEDSFGLPKFSPTSFESDPPSLGDEDPLTALSNNRETMRTSGKWRKGDRRPGSHRSPTLWLQTKRHELNSTWPNVHKKTIDL